MLMRVPTCGSNSTANSSPALMNSFGVLAAPTPGGVPVKMIVPAGKVVPCDKKLINFGTEKIRSVRGQSCITRPLLRPRILNLLASGIKAAETSTGPKFPSQL